MRSASKGLSVALAVLIGVTPFTSPLSAYATQLSDQVIVYDTAANDDAYAADDDAVSLDETDFAAVDDGTAVDDGFAADDEAFAVDDSSEQAETDAQSYVTDEGTVEEYDASGQTVWTGDSANADRKDDEEYVDSDANLTPSSWRYKDGVLTVSGGGEDDLLDAQSLSDSLPSGAIARGIDVSTYQGKIDWEKVKAAGIKFAIIRIGPAYGQIDDCFERNASECDRLGIPYGIYYYSYARTVSEANRDADRVFTWLGSHRPQLPIYYDIEDDWINPNNLVISKQTLTTNINTFCSRIKAGGFTAGIYSSTSWYRNFLDDSSLRQWDTWVAQWWDHCTYEGSYSLWQYSSEGSVPGIEGNVDMNYAYNFSSILVRNTSGAATHKNDLPDGTYSFSASSNYVEVIDVAGGSTSNKANVQLYASNATSAQLWKVTHDSEGFVILTNVRSGKVLDIKDGICTPGANVQQFDYNGSDAQKWVAIKESDGTYTFVSALNKDYVLDLAGGSTANGSNLQVYYSNATAAQRFTATNKNSGTVIDLWAKQNASVLSDGTYTLGSSLNSSKVMDVAGASKANGGNVQIYANNGTNAQKWTVSHDSNGYVTLTNVSSGKVLDVDGAIAVNGRNIQQYASNGTKAQKWVAVKSGSGFKLCSALDPSYVIDISGASTANGANLQLYSSNGTKAQIFVK